MKKYLNYLAGALCCLIVSGLYYYFELPPINIHSPAFWSFFVVALLAFAVPFGLFSAVRGAVKRVRMKNRSSITVSLTVKVLLILAAIPVVVMIIGGISSSTFLGAKQYASVIEVQSADFETDMPETTTVTNIALMDSESAQIIGNRTLGSLSAVVSQYEAGTTYNQINYHGAPQKVSLS